jgi:hypothetical protein
VTKPTDKNRFATAVVLMMAVSFGLLSLARYTRPLKVSHPRSLASTDARPHLTRNAIEEVSPTGPRLTASGWSTRSPVALDEIRTHLQLTVVSAGIWPESGQIQHRRIPAPSPDAPASV